MSPETPSQPQPSYQPAQPTPPMQPTPPVAPTPTPANGSKGLSIAALVLAFVVAPVGLVLSIIALAKHRPGKGLALAALIVSIFNIIVSSILILITIVAFQGIQQKAKDQQATSDANAVSISVEGYAANSATYDSDFNIHYSYPSAAQMKDASWITSNLKSLNAEAADAFATTSSVYNYKPTPDGCANTSTSECTSYEITYRLSTGTKTLKSATSTGALNEADNSSTQ